MWSLTWIPPVSQELTSSEGNLTLLWRHFTNPPEAAIGVRQGLDVFLVHLNPWRLVVAARRRDRRGVARGRCSCSRGRRVRWSRSGAGCARCIALDVVLAVALVLGLFSIASIFGFVWYYLMLWAWILNGLMIFATVWAVGIVVRTIAEPPCRDGGRIGARRRRGVVFAVIAVVYLTGFAVDASTVEPPTPRVSTALGVLDAPTIRAIDAGTVPGGGRGGPVPGDDRRHDEHQRARLRARVGARAGRDPRRVPADLLGDRAAEADRDQGRGDGGHPLRERQGHRGVAGEAGRGRGRARRPADAGRAAGERAPARPGASRAATAPAATTSSPTSPTTCSPPRSAPTSRRRSSGSCCGCSTSAPQAAVFVGPASEASA